MSLDPPQVIAGDLVYLPIHFFYTAATQVKQKYGQVLKTNISYY